MIFTLAVKKTPELKIVGSLNVIGSVFLFEIHKFISVAVLNTPLGNNIRKDIQNTPFCSIQANAYNHIVKFFFLSENQGGFLVGI